MRGISMPFHLQEKGAFDIQDFTSICSQAKWKKKQQHQQEVNSNNNGSSFFSCSNNEPTSVLLMRRSQSPPTSASTLSSSLNNTITTTDNTPTIPQESVASLLNNERKDEWATELQPLPIPTGLEVITAGGERCSLGLEDWDSMFSETSQEQSILRWIAGDMDDTSFGIKQLLQSGGNAHNPLVDFDGNAAGLGVVDQGLNFEPFSGLASGNGIATGVANLGAFSGPGFVSSTNGNGNGNGKIASTSGPVNHKLSSVGLHSSNSNGNNNSCNSSSAVFGSIGNSNNMPLAPAPVPSGVINQPSQNFVETTEEKPQIFNPHILMNHNQVQFQHHQNPNLMLPLAFHQQQEHLHHMLQPQPKRHNSGGSSELSPRHVPKPPFSDPGHELLLRNQAQQMGFSQNLQFLPPHLQQKPLMVTTKQKVLGAGNEEMARQQHALLDQLYKAAELVGTGNFSHAQGILARLNHQLSSVGKPLLRAAFYFKEALQLLLLMNNPAPPPRSPTPFDVIFKMGAYKVFSEVSPVIQFVNFTCNQALLEAVDDADRIHIIDFDIGFGAQWASFMQELPVRSNRRAPSLKITAFASPLTHHPIELGLMRENLTQFANEIGVSFELDVVNLDSLDQTSYNAAFFRTSENEAVAVNLPIWSSSNQLSAFPSLLRFVKQLSPKIVVSSDRGCDRSDLPFPEHILHALQSHINLLESLDAANAPSEAVNKIERFLLLPRIESTVLGRARFPERMPFWKTLFASAGFSSVPFSNFTETQAECVVKRTPVRGFHVEKRQASLVLCWQRRELISASAWRC